MNNEMYKLFKDCVDADIDTKRKRYDQISREFRYSMGCDTNEKKLVGNLTDGYVEIDKNEYAKNIMSIEAINKLLGKPYNSRSRFKFDITLSIKKVIFNNPATIVYWTDGTKTVVKCVNETFDKEKGFSMAIVKKILGNQGNYYNQIRKWVEDCNEDSDNE